MSERWWCLGALTLARTAMGFQFQSVAAVAPPMADALGLDKAQIGWLIGLYLLPGVVLALPGGLMGSRFGDKPMVLVGLSLMATGGAWLAFAGNYAEANAARLISGAGAVMLNVLVTKMVTDWFEGKERLLAMSVLINAWPIGIGIALVVIGPLTEYADWSWGLASTTAFAIAGAAAVAIVYRAPPVPAIAVPTAVAGLRTLSRREWALLAVASPPWFLYNAAFQIMMAFLPSFFIEEGLTLSEAGNRVAVIAVLFVTGVQAGGIFLRHSVRTDGLCHLALFAWSGSLLLLASHSTSWSWIIAAGLLGGLPAALLVSLPGEFLRPESRSAGMGLFYTIYYFGCALLPALAGLLYDLEGGRAAFWLAAALTVSCAGLLAISRVAMSRSEDRPQ
jgi:MFS family permease